MTEKFSETFRNNIVDLRGEQGQKWLESLDDIVQNLAKKWNLSHLKAFSNLTYNYVLSGYQNGNVPVVLKVGIENDLLQKEAEMLRFFVNYGAVTLIDSCDGALLLQRCVPGYSLTNYFPNDEENSIEIIANVIKKLHSASLKQNMSTVTPLKELLNDLYQLSNVAENYVAKARDFSESLLKTTTKNVVMHGDLHHDNVIYDESAQSWKIIDPAGVIGDPTYEYTSFMINPIDKIWKCDNALSIIEKRIQKFAQIADINPHRLRQWTFAKAVLCLVWTEGTQNQDRLELVKLFDKII